MRHALTLVATLVASLFCSSGNCDDVKNKGHIIFDVRNAIEHLKDVNSWRATYTTLPVVMNANAPTTTSLVKFLKDEGTSWVAVKALGGATRLHQFSDVLIDDCFTTGIQLLPMVMPLYNTDDSAFNQGHAANLLLKRYGQTTGIKTVLIMPTDSFYQRTTETKAQLYVNEMFKDLKKKDGYSYVYCPERAVYDPDTDKQRAVIHRILSTNRFCSAIMPRMYWFKNSDVGTSLTQDSDFYKRSVKAWGAANPTYLGGNALLLMGQVEQEYCDPEKDRLHHAVCENFGFYGQIPTPSNPTSGVALFMKNFVNYSPGPGLPKKFDAIGVAFWDFEDFNPLEHQEFESSIVEQPKKP